MNYFDGVHTLNASSIYYVCLVGEDKLIECQAIVETEGWPRINDDHDNK